MGTVLTIVTHTCPRVCFAEILVSAKICICRRKPRETFVPTLYKVYFLPNSVISKPDEVSFSERQMHRELL